MPSICSDPKLFMIENASYPQALNLVDESKTVLVAQAMADIYQQQPAHSRVNLVTLAGDLGVGKTTLVRAFLRALGWCGPVKSPTYNFVESYDLPQGSVVHFDFYRLADAEELEHLGARDYFLPTSLCWVEWPERGQQFLPTADLALTLRSNGAQGRMLEYQSHSHSAQPWVAAMQKALEKTA